MTSSAINWLEREFNAWQAEWRRVFSAQLMPGQIIAPGMFSVKYGSSAESFAARQLPPPPGMNPAHP